MSGIEELLSGRTLVKRYRIEEVIGRGGFAAVYRADDQRLGRPVAVKVITLSAPDAETRERHRERFEREARSAASLPQHPNVVTVHDFGVDPELGLDFLVMEFLHGQDLASYLRANGRPPLEMGLRILRDAAEGLAVGHRANLLHRDVKPGNIFLAEPRGDRPPRVCVLDFGIARALTDNGNITQLTQEGAPLSPAYASPEQFRGERDLTCASDVFSLGVVAYQLLTGEKPFSAERTTDPAAWRPLRGIRELNPEVPEAVEAVVMRALAYDPQERFEEADSFARALDEAMAASDATMAVPVAAGGAAAAAAASAAYRPSDEHTVIQPEEEPLPPPPPPPSVGARERPAERRSRAGVWAGVLALLAVVAVGLWAMGGGGGADGGDTEVAAPPVVEALPEGGAGTAGGIETPVPAVTVPEGVDGSAPAVVVVPGASAPAAGGGAAPIVVPQGGRTPPAAGGTPRAPAQGGAPAVQPTPGNAPAQQPQQQQPAQQPQQPPAQQPQPQPQQQQPQQQQPAQQPQQGENRPPLLGEPVTRPQNQGQGGGNGGGNNAGGNSGGNGAAASGQSEQRAA